MKTRNCPTNPHRRQNFRRTNPAYASSAIALPTEYRPVLSLLLVLVILLTGWHGQANAALPASTQFDITGFLQTATVDNPSDPHSGGKLTVNGQVVTVPAETIVILPANALTWQELFSKAPAPYTGASTGMAMADTPQPIATYEVHVVGNRVGDTYIAGLIDIAQQALNSGAGYINFIDYGTGELKVGGILGDGTTGTRVRINDPAGRYGRVATPDERFTVDPDNPTIMSATGYPMCLPRVLPGTVNSDGSVGDALCPETNRPGPVDPVTGTGSNFTMQDPASPPDLAGGLQSLDPRIQAPMEVGDFVTFAGTLVNDTATPTVFAAGVTTYVSAHTIVNNTAIYTAPHTDPAYVMTEVTIIGTGGLTVVGAGEAAIRTRFEGMSTDATRPIHLYGIDFDPLTGATSDRDFGTIGVDPGPAGGAGAVQGRWRFRPPCAPFGTDPTTIKFDKQCIFGQTGTFLPPPREVRAVIEGLQGQVPGTSGAKTAANGIFYGQYHAPILEYIFPENVPGSPIVENNFNTLGFLAMGGYSSSAGTLVKQLNPWPSNVTPAPACQAPTVNTGGPYTVAAGGTIALAGSASGTAPFTYAWSASSGSLSDATIASPTYSAMGSASPVSLSLAVSNACGTNTVSTTVTVNGAAAPTVNHVVPITVNSGAVGNFSVSGIDPNSPPQALSFAVSQSGTPVLLPPPSCAGSLQGALCVTSTGSGSAVVTFTAPTLPLGQTTSSVINLSIVATNTGATASAAEVTSVTVKPLVDTVNITSTEYRIGKQRLVITATTSVNSPSVVLSLRPYVTNTGSTFDPSVLGNTFSLVNGVPTLTLVGAPAPACNPGGAFATPCSATPLVVTSNLGGVSPALGLQRIRN